MIEIDNLITKEEIAVRVANGLGFLIKEVPEDNAGAVYIISRENLSALRENQGKHFYCRAKIIDVMLSIGIEGSDMYEEKLKTVQKVPIVLNTEKHDYCLTSYTNFIVEWMKSGGWSYREYKPRGGQSENDNKR